MRLTRRSRAARPVRHARHRRWWQHTSEEIYAYRTRRPYGPGRHWGYVGRTNDPVRRDREHLVGGGQYGAVAKPWADLEPRRYVLFAKRRRLELTTHLLEWSMIRLLMPVYNVSMNGVNPRRIKPWTQDAQRARRDARMARASFRPGLASVGNALLVVLIIASALSTYGLTRMI